MTCKENIITRSLLGVEIMISNYHGLPESIRNQIFRTRKEVFIDRKQWNIESYCGGDIEFDQYDNSESYYLCTINDNNITGCVRLRPSTSPTLMTGSFRWLKDTTLTKSIDNNNTWEASRYFITPALTNSEGQGLFDCRTLALFLCMIDFGMTVGFTNYEVVVDASMARILRMSGWHLKVLNSGLVSRNEKIYYGLLPCNELVFANIYKINDKLKEPLIKTAQDKCKVISS